MGPEIVSAILQATAQPNGESRWASLLSPIQSRRTLNPQFRENQHFRVSFLLLGFTSYYWEGFAFCRHFWISSQIILIWLPFEFHHHDVYAYAQRSCVHLQEQLFLSFSCSIFLHLSGETESFCSFRIIGAQTPFMPRSSHTGRVVF